MVVDAEDARGAHGAGQQLRRQPRRPAADDRDGVAGLQSCELEAGEGAGHDVRQKRRLGIADAFGQALERGVRGRHAHVFGLGAAELAEAEHAALLAGREDAFLAVEAAAAEDGERRDDAVAGLERRHGAANFLDDAREFVADGRLRGHGDAPAEDADVGAANRGHTHPDDGVARVLDLRPRPLLDRDPPLTFVDDCFHGLRIAGSAEYRVQSAVRVACTLHSALCARGWG